MKLVLGSVEAPQDLTMHVSIGTEGRESSRMHVEHAQLGTLLVRRNRARSVVQCQLRSG